LNAYPANRKWITPPIWLLVSICAGSVVAAVLATASAGSFWMAGLVAAGVIFSIAVFCCPDLGIISALIIAGVGGQLLRAVGLATSSDGDISLASIGALGVLAVTLVAIWVRPAARARARALVRYSLPAWGALGLVVWNALVALFGWRQHGLFAALTDADWVLWIGFWFAVCLSPSRRLAMRSVSTVYILATWLATSGFVRLVQDSGSFLSTGGSRYVPGSASLIIAAGLVASASMLLEKRARWKPLIAVIAAAQLGGVLISFNRQTWVALLAAGVFGFFTLYRGKRMVSVTMAVLAGILLIGLWTSGLLPAQLQDTLYKRVGGGSIETLLRDPSVQYRLSAWKTAIEGTLASPIIGQGWGSPFWFTRITGTGHIQWVNVSPHNTYLWLAFKSGLPSLVVFVTLNAILLLRAVSAHRRALPVDASLSMLLKATIMAQVVFLVGALWWDYLSIMYLSVPIWVNSALLAVLAGTTPQPHDENRRHPTATIA